MTTGSTEEDPTNAYAAREIHKANGARVIHQNGNIQVPKEEDDATTIPTYSTSGKLPHEIGTDYTFKRKLVWFNITGFMILHLIALYGFFLSLFVADFKTLIFTLAITLGMSQGVTMGAHRLWSHRTFKATFIVRLVLIILQTMSGQNCLYVWARDHRLHHKYSDTDADPHNSNRGFFFSHIGWLMSKKHPAVIQKGKTIDMSDLEADSLVMFQKKYYNVLYLLFAISIPMAVPILLWNESYINSFCIVYMLRYIISLHVTWLVNSAAHMFGTKPYDQTIIPVQSELVSFLALGEGWHNFHHAFPWDYRASEYGSKFNVTTQIIDLCAYVGLVYDLKAAPAHMVKHRTQKAGDGSHPLYGATEEEIKKREENVKGDNKAITDNTVKRSIKQIKSVNG